MVDCQYTPAQMYMEIVNRRDRNSLVDILNQRLEANSVIHSDKCRAYLNRLTANPTKMVKHTQTIRRQLADELFECV